MSNDSERLDGEVLGEHVGDDGLPGVGGYPPDSARGVNDPNLVADDDVAMREARHRSEPFERVLPAEPDATDGDDAPIPAAVAAVRIRVA